MKGTRILALFMATAITLISVSVTPLLSYAEEVLTDAESKKVLSNITEDTILNNDNENIYYLEKDIQIAPSVTLQLEGITIEGNGYSIKNYGSIVAQGCTFEDVSFKACNQSYAPCSYTMDSCLMDGGELLPPTGGSSHSYISLKNNVFNNLSHYTYIWYPADVAVIDHNIFYGFGGLSIGSDYDVYITNNSFSNLNSNSSCGYMIRNWAQYGGNCYVNNNNFSAEKNILKIEYSTGKMEASSNYWNTMDTSVIDERIYDYNDDYSCSGTINYLPILQTESTTAPKINCSTIGHTWDNGTVTTKATCATTGIKTYTCSVCDATKTETIEKDASNHAGGTENKEAKEATCVEDGYTGDTYCKGCGAKIKSGESIPATGKHTWDDGEVTKEATETEEGVKTYICKVCNTTKTESIHQLTHTHKLGTKHQKVEATCSTTGTIEYYDCTGCDAKLDQDGNVIMDLTIAQNPENHGTNETETKNAKEATCVSDGYTGDTYCSVCGNKISDGEKIPATGSHTWNDGEVTTKATCVAKGAKTFTCAVCGETKTEPVAIDPDNHTGETEIRNAKEATTMEEGYTGDTYCTGCSVKLQEGTVIPKIESDDKFSDISDCSNGVKTAIIWAADNGIVSGYNDGTFKPTDNCTRQQMVIMLWRLAGKPTPTNLDDANKFTDTASLSSGSKKAIAWAVENGITSGYSDGTFRPTDNVTRLQTVIMLWRLAGKPAPSSTSANFTDISSLSANSQKAIYWAAENGITKGTKQSDGSYLFAPNDPCQRQHIATFVYRYAQKY